MKNLLKSSRFKLIVAIIALLLAGMLICAANGHGESAQSSIVGTIFTPAHWVAGKLSDGLDKITSNAKGDAQYEQKIDELQKELGELQNQLADYNNLKSQNELYKDALELKEDNPDFKYLSASVIGRDSANPYCSFTISKGSLNGVKDGDAVLYGKYLVGVIKKAYPTYSVVSSIIDPDFSVSAYDINTKELSYVTGDAEIAKDGYCKFENLDSTTKIAYGSIIATAGISSAMPKGIIIGTVRDINDEATNISTYALIEPGTDITRLDECLILIGFSAESEAN
ncbi:MAG: rod shape-determining protein MreC [Eubacterium sp.]|nr:rod shape-determining protein MreC [Eubacterium sp.]MDE6766587.1 rod shape-determining protein MreC [Eubacterium sp.]